MIINDTPIGYGNVSTTMDGLMSKEDKIKLNGIAEGATANTGTVTSVGVKINDVIKGTVTTSGVIDLGVIEGGESSWQHSDVEDLAFAAGTASIGADWTWVSFPREFMYAPVVTASLVGSGQSASVTIANVTTTGFQAAIYQGATPSSATTYTSSSTEWTATSTTIVTAVNLTTKISGTIQYIACLDTGVGK